MPVVGLGILEVFLFKYMAKDSYWFKHDSTAGRGTRMRKMTFIYSHWGKGVYWDVIEILREQDGYRFEKDEISLSMLCEIVGCKDTQKFINWFNDCVKINLLQIDETHFFSEVLIENMENWETSKVNGSKGGRPKKTQTKPGDKPKQNQSHNLNETIREEYSRVEEKREDKKIIDIWFEDLKNGSAIETISIQSKIDKTKVLEKLEEFKRVVDLHYPDYKAFVRHFKNWLLKNPPALESKYKGMVF